MITIIIGALALAIPCVLMNMIGRSGSSQTVGSTIFSLLVGGFLGLIVAACIPAKHAEVGRKPLVCLQDNSAIHGSFFLGTGSIDEHPVYAYYVMGNDGCATLETVSTHRAKIKYTTGEPAVVRMGNVNHWSISEPYLIFEIPQGSIVNGYRLDAQ